MRTEECRDKIDSAAIACNLEEKTVLHVKRSCGISDRLTESFPEISVLATDAVLELGKKKNKEVLKTIIPLLQKKMSDGIRPTKREVTQIIQNAKNKHHLNK